MGLAYEYGQGVEQDYDEAVKWFRLSAEQGVATSPVVSRVSKARVLPPVISPIRKNLSLPRVWANSCIAVAK